MVGFISREVNETGKVRIDYTGNEFNFQEVLVNINNDLQVLSQSDTIIVDFLRNKVNWQLNVKDDGIFNVELFFLQDIGYVETNENLLVKTNIYNILAESSTVCINREFYLIDKKLSTANSVCLDRPVNVAECLVYKVKKAESTLIRLFNLKQQCVRLMLEFDCSTEKERAKLYEKLVRIKLIESINTDLTNKIQLFNSIDKC